jgi:hypothetical protein
MPAAFNFQQRESQIAQRKAMLAELLKQQGQIEQAPQGQMVSGHYVAPSIFQQLTPFAKQVGLQYRQGEEEKGLAKETEEYSAEDRRQAIEHALSRPQATPELQGPVDPNNPTALEGYQPSQQVMSAWAQQGAGIPSRKDIVSKLLADIEVNAPIRKDEQTFKSKESAQTRAAAEAEAERARIEKAAEAALTRADRDKRERDLAKQRSEDLRYSTDQNNETRRMVIASNLERASGKAGSKEAAAENAKVGDAKEVLNLLDEASGLLPQATSSGIGTAVDAGLRYFGKSTASADAAARLKVIGGLLTSKMPKMSGPQSDKDVAQYKEMAGQLGDPTIPVSQKISAAQTVREINERYAHLNPGSSSPPTAAPRVKTQAEVDRLPKGTTFIGPDGKTYRKD